MDADCDNDGCLYRIKITVQEGVVTIINDDQQLDGVCNLEYIGVDDNRGLSVVKRNNKVSIVEFRTIFQKDVQIALSVLCFTPSRNYNYQMCLSASSSVNSFLCSRIDIEINTGDRKTASSMFVIVHPILDPLSLTITSEEIYFTRINSPLTKFMFHIQDRDDYYDAMNNKHTKLEYHVTGLEEGFIELSSPSSSTAHHLTTANQNSNKNIKEWSNHQSKSILFRSSVDDATQVLCSIVYFPPFRWHGQRKIHLSTARVDSSNNHEIILNSEVKLLQEFDKMRSIDLIISSATSPSTVPCTTPLLPPNLNTST